MFGRFAGFELGWIYYIARAAAFAANANVLTAYSARWVAGADEGVLRAAILIGATALFAAVNVAGVRKSIGLLDRADRAQGAAVVHRRRRGDRADLSRGRRRHPAPTLTEFEAGLLIVLYAFVGFEQAVVPAGETKDPGRNLPRAIFFTIGVTTLLYFLVQLAFVSALPGGASDEKAPLIDLGAGSPGPFGAAALTMAALASLAGSLHGIMTSTPRVSYALADARRPAGMVRRGPSAFETPANSILFFAVFAAALAISGSFVWLAVVSTLARMIVYAVTIAALPRAPGKRRLGLRHWLLGAARDPGLRLGRVAGRHARPGRRWPRCRRSGCCSTRWRRGAGSSNDAAVVSAIQPPPSSREPS